MVYVKNFCTGRMSLVKKPTLESSGMYFFLAIISNCYWCYIFDCTRYMKCPIKSGFILWLPEVLLQARIITHSELLLYPRLDFCSQEARVWCNHIKIQGGITGVKLTKPSFCVRLKMFSTFQKWFWICCTWYASALHNGFSRNILSLYWPWHQFLLN